MAPKPKPAKKPAVIVSGVRQSNRNKQKVSNPPLARPPKKAKQTIVEIDSSDGDNGNNQDDTDDEDNEELREDDDPSDHLKRLDVMSAQDVSKRKPRVRSKDKWCADVELVFKSQYDKNRSLIGYFCNICR